MVQLDVVRACNKALINKQPVTAVFVGGTSGIGEYSLRALAALHGSGGHGLRIYLVGRNQKAADTILADCKKLCPVGDFHFVSASDLASLREVDRVCSEITRLIEGNANQSIAIDLLVMSQALFSFGSKLERQVTTEGLDQSLSLLYYSRMRFVTQLLPLLTASPLPGRVVSVFGPGRDTKLIQDDLPLNKPGNFNFTTLGSHAAYMTTFFFEKIAANNPGQISLSHYFPMLVITPAFKGDGVPGWFKGVYTVLSPVFRLLSVNPQECGDRVLFHTSARFPARPPDSQTHSAMAGRVTVATSSDGIRGGGAYRVNHDGEDVPLGKGYKTIRKDETREKVWNHTMTVFRNIEHNGHFSG
ncbi:hypothetical protein PV08_05949 [Exophiala spinifera]|uniref:Ketoreductase (KR) domain-containing protein n=1 Tax=Exophiala spinifera TaxID=91928 RepID=A0A0D2BX76_9EURO|nr:uncharacterized protein PV08_05949 [Exophiala spinifera]KIW15899.1 hypothetical protein PV08_05949 [Exophiala spinifera]